MTAMPVPSHDPTALDHPLTVAEYAALGETKSGYTELIEGSLLMSPSPTPKHNKASYKLASQLEPQLPAHLDFFQDVDIDLELGPADDPGFSRRPDLILVDRSEADRVDSKGGILRASAVHVVIEIVSPGSRRTDNIHKLGEYEEAGIPWYWIIDIEKSISLVSYRLTRKSGYQAGQRVTGVFTAMEPFPVTIDLDRLV